MRVRHPGAVEGEAVDVDGTYAPVEDGAFTVPDEASSWLDRWADANGYDLEELLVSDGSEPESDDADAETCDTVMSNGDVCGRALPCQYHTED